MAYPTSKTNAVDNTTEIVAAHLNNLESKVGIDGSADANSIDYQLKNTTGGHDHDGVDSKLLGALYKFVPGMGMLWYGAIANIPSLWAFANGASLLRASYTELFANIATIWGSADGTHFNLPDLRDKVVFGAKQDDSGVPKTNVTGALLASGGAATVDLSHTHTTGDHAITTAEMPVHTHVQDAHTHIQDSHTHVVPADGGTDNSGGPYARYDGGSSGAGVTTAARTAVNQSTVATNQNAGSGAAHNHGATGSAGIATQSILPPFVAAVPIIFTGV
jgi:microcystin-dependent protein